eukprot:m51a1_g5060 hypothetical protein (274) ;mRNA; f:113179-114207
MSRWVDSHCHLELLADPEAALAAARARGVGTVLAVGSARAGWPRVLALERGHPPGAVVAALGLHPRPPADPDACDTLGPAALAEALDEALRAAPRVVGEIGLHESSKARAGRPLSEAQRARQREVLEAQLGLAERLRAPVNLHSWRCDAELLGAAEEFRGRSGLSAALHWFTRTPLLTARALRSGLYVSLGPSLDRDAAERAGVVQALLEAGGEAASRGLLLESDGPEEHGGLQAEPCWVPAVGASVARLLGVSEGDVRDMTSRNFDRYLSGQ